LRDLLAPSAPAAEEGPPGDAQQPALVAALAAPGRGHAPRLEERLLRQVLRALPARQAAEERADPPLVPSHQVRESGNVARRRQARQLLIAQESAPRRARYQ